MEAIVNTLKNLDGTKLFYGILVLVICLLISKSIMKLMDGVLKKARAIDPSLHTMIRTTLKWLLYFISIVAAAGTLGIPVTSFLTLFSVIGLAVSLAIQGVLTNLAGGVIILASKPFSLGDYIESDSISGTVKDIGFLHTRLISPDGKLIFVPNNLLYTARLINYTASGERRIDLTVNASYDNSPSQVRAAVERAIAEIPAVRAEPAPQVLVEAYGDSAIQYTIRLWTASQDFMNVRYELNERLYGAFHENGVEMTYPHLNVHVREN
ncbi:MAG: mechanosensitive ion channel family protein [Clostridia bacterium]|nr:mechanosensitive ion channel family protein [Clostridia bacterium]